MGLLGKITSAVSKVASNVATGVKNAGIVVAQSTGVARLWGDKATPTVNPSVAKIPVVGALAKTLVEHPYTTAAVVAAPFTSVGKTAASTVVKAVVKTAAANPIKATIATAVIAPVIAGTVVKDPNKAITTVSNAPSAVTNFEKNIYTAAKDPSISNILNIAKENPLLTAAVTAPVIAAGLKTLTVPAVLAVDKILEPDKKTVETPAPIVSPVAAPAPEKSPAISPAAATSPVTPQTQPIVATAGSSSKSSKRRKKTPIKASVPSVRQNLNVIIQNRNQSLNISKRERIIKRELLAY